MSKLLLWDLDGTLSDDRQRQHLYQEQRWAEYFSYEAQMSDPVYPEARALYEEMKSQGWEMGYLSARLERNRPASFDWLTKHGFDNPHRLYLRPEADSIIRPARFKAAVLEDFIDFGGYDFVVLVDNDPLVADRIRTTLGEQHFFFASWDKNPQTASIAAIPTQAVEPL